MRVAMTTSPFRPFVVRPKRVTVHGCGSGRQRGRPRSCSEPAVSMPLYFPFSARQRRRGVPGVADGAFAPNPRA